MASIDKINVNGADYEITLSSTATLSIASLTVTGSTSLGPVNIRNGRIFAGSTASIRITLPHTSGTLALMSDIPTLSAITVSEINSMFI